MLFYKHQPETDEQHIKRVSEKISKILKDENLTFDVQMIPQIRILPISKPKVEVKEEKKDAPTSE